MGGAGTGEAVVCDPNGVAIFDALHRRDTVSEATLNTFDLLELDGEDLRGRLLSDREKRLARLVRRRRVDIVLSAHTAGDGATIFQQACKLGLEGIVSKRLSAPYRSGASRDWLKINNPNSPAISGGRAWLNTMGGVPLWPGRIRGAKASLRSAPNFDAAFSAKWSNA
jgi:bifunctional non-homologous end joining protein LigD